MLTQYGIQIHKLLGLKTDMWSIAYQEKSKPMICMAANISAKTDM